MPSEFTSEYHVHIIVRQGEMRFSDGKQMYVSQKDNLVIWQMSNAIQDVTYSEGFEADFLIVSGDFLSRFNPEMVWASKGFIFIRINPSFHLHEQSLRLMDNDFALFRQRLDMPESPYREEVIGRVMQIFLYDLWTVYSAEMSQMETNDNAARIFLRFLSLVQKTADSSAMWPIMPICSESRRSISRRSAGRFQVFLPRSGSRTTPPSNSSRCSTTSRKR